MHCRHTSQSSLHHHATITELMTIKADIMFTVHALPLTLHVHFHITFKWSEATSYLEGRKNTMLCFGKQSAALHQLLSFNMMKYLRQSQNMPYSIILSWIEVASCVDKFLAKPPRHSWLYKAMRDVATQAQRGRLKQGLLWKLYACLVAQVIGVTNRTTWQQQ